MHIELAAPSDVDRMNEISEAAKAAMREAGIDQWQDGYPNRACWQVDVESGFAYVARGDKGKAVGAFSLVADAATGDPEPSYAKIDGAWLTSDANYAAIHRVCVAPEAKGRGVATAMFAFACEKARDLGLSSLRVDTHVDNVPMQRTLAKAGFTLCGTIVLVDGVDAGGMRVAFEKLV